MRRRSEVREAFPADDRRALRAGWGPFARAGVVAVGCLALAHCASSDKFARKIDPKYGVAASPRVVEAGEAVPKGGGTYRVGKPYQVAGRTYVPEEDLSYRADGMASWYGDDFHGRLTANGEVFDMHGISAAHPTLPMPCYVRVTNLANHRSLIVRVNDRGPYHGDRVIDVSHRAANLLAFHGHGVARVRVEYVGHAPLEGSDDRMLTATLRQGQPAPAPSLVMVAAARPFVPELGGGRPLQGEIPVPPGRPFSLGEPQPMADFGSPTDVTAVARPHAVESAGLQAPSARLATETSGYARLRRDPSRDVPVSFMSGHALY